jgi:hypothetical protein
LQGQLTNDGPQLRGQLDERRDGEGLQRGPIPRKGLEIKASDKE